MNQRVFCISLTERMLEEAYELGVLPFVETDPVIVPNPAKDPVWIAKMANWIAMLVLSEARLKRTSSVVRVFPGGIRIHEKDEEDDDRFSMNDDLARPMRPYIDQIYASYNPYEMDDTDHAALFLQEVHEEIFDFMKKNWKYCPRLVEWSFEFSWGKE